MAMIRTINHPGVQIQESQIGNYSSPIVLNNTAYIMGFTDRGPIYDYSWIMNKNDFTKIYGQPQTEAEIYLFTAVQSVLANGGTPIVARMPYDNKQCQSYKATKFMWETKAEALGKQRTGTAEDTPVVPLNEMTSGIAVAKTFSDATSGIFAVGAVTDSSGAVISGDTLKGINTENLLAMLNPFDTTVSGDLIWQQRAGFKDYLINDAAPSSICVDSTAVNSTISELSGIYINASGSIVTPGTSGILPEGSVGLLSANIGLLDKFLKTNESSLIAVSGYSQISNINKIYNNVVFLKKTQKEVQKLQAKFLEAPEMGFKNGLYLDGVDCEVSNDQYDSLVTVNKFEDADASKSKYGSKISDANFIIIDKQKTIATGSEGNIGFFTTIIDPFDALKVQRLLVNPQDAAVELSQPATSLTYWAGKSVNSWNQMYDVLLDSMDTLQKVRNADGMFIGQDVENTNAANSWAVPLYGTYYNESISKTLMKKFIAIPMADINSDSLEDPNFVQAIIDHQYSTHVLVAVCNTYVDQSTGKIAVNIAETFFGSLFNQKNPQTGKSLYIGDIINGNSEFIEFYKNTAVKSADSAYIVETAPAIPQVYIKDSDDLKTAALLRGVDWDNYSEGLSGSYNQEEYQKAFKNYQNALASSFIYVIDKKDTCIYSIKWEANFSSFSKKESQKIIANTTGLTSYNQGTTVNVAKNFLTDMDRCINFIKNRDDVPITFVCDAGLTTIAQFCDNVTWIDKKKKVAQGKYTGGWVTQPFAPDDDPDAEDRKITSYADIATWRKVAEKLISICSETRKDCFAIIDAPRQLTLDGAAPKIRKSKFENDFDKTIGKALRFITGFNTSYAAGYYNWLRATDQYSGKSYWIPPTSKIIGNYCYLNISNLPWLAPAGLTYGVLTGCHGISHNPNYQEEDQIYMKSWNYIKQYPAEGFVVEGQRTLLAKESVFERINIRLLFLDLQRFAYAVSRTFKYQINNTYTREQFVATLKPKFEDYALRGGIVEYLIKVDSQNNTPQTIDQNELRGDIFIKPGRLIEYVLLNFIGTTTGTDFNELPMG